MMGRGIYHILKSENEKQYLICQYLFNVSAKFDLVLIQMIIISDFPSF